MTNHLDTNGYKSDHFGTHTHKPDHQSQSHRVMMQEICRIAVRVSQSQTKCDWSTTTYGRSKALLQQQEPLQLLPMVLNGTGSEILPLPTCRLALPTSSHVKACTMKRVSTDIWYALVTNITGVFRFLSFQLPDLPKLCTKLYAFMHLPSAGDS